MKKLLLALPLAILGLLSGCATPDRDLERPEVGARKPTRAPSTRVRIAGSSIEGRAIEVRELVGSSPLETVLFLATIHGDEAAGTPLLEAVEGYLRQRPELLQGKRLVLVPVTNPDGYAHSTRFNARGVDLNRNFPADNFARKESGAHGDDPLSEPESQVLHALLHEHRPSRIVSIHQPLSCIDHDGPADELAALMGEHCDLPVKKLGGRPGSLGSYAGITLGIPIITFELPADASSLSNEELFSCYGPALLAALSPEASALRP
jgi:protein MpaA